MQLIRSKQGLVLISVLAVMGLKPALAQSTLWQTYYDSGISALKTCRIDKAQKQFRSALKEAERSTKTIEDFKRLQITLRAYGDSLSKAQKHRDAEFIYKRLVELGSGTGGDEPTSQVSAEDLCNYAHNQDSLSKFKESVALYKRALDLLEKDKSKGSEVEQIKLLINLSGVYMQLGDADKAEESLRDGMKLAEELNDDISVARVLEGFGRFYSHMGRFEEAESMLKKAVNLQLKGTGASESHIDSTYLNLANAYRNHGDVEAAILYIGKAIKLRKSCGPKSDPIGLAQANLELASVYEEKDWIKEAALVLQRTLTNLESTMGDESPLVTIVLRRLATDYVSMNEYAKAEPLLKRALELAERVHGENSGETAKDLQALGMFYVAQGKYDLAEPVYKRSLDMVRNTYGDEHPNYASCLNNLAWLYVNESKFDQARPLVEKGLEIRRDSLGEEHPLVARNLSNLANIDIYQNKFDDARDNLAEALKIQGAVLGFEHPDTLDTMNRLADVHSKLKEYSKAEQLYRKVLTLDEKLEGEDSAAVADDLDNLAKVISYDNRQEEVNAMRRRASGIKAKLPGNVPGTGSHGIYLDSRKAHLEPLPPVSDKWALVVGISSFADTSINLQYAAKDAMDFRNYLVNEANFKTDRVKLLLDENATRDNIVANLGPKWLGKAKKGDLVVIYISSHGTSARKDLGDTNFIVAHETNLSNAVLTGIPMQWFTTGITEMLEAKRIVIMMDVCHGGAVTPAKILVDNGLVAKSMVVKESDGKGLKRDFLNKENLEAVRGQVIIASSQADQTSYESIHYPNGVFTRKLIEGLRVNGKATTLENAFSFMRGKVESEVLRDRRKLQTPIMIGGSSEDGQLVLSIEPKLSGDLAQTSKAQKLVDK